MASVRELLLFGSVSGNDAHVTGESHTDTTIGAPKELSARANSLFGTLSYYEQHTDTDFTVKIQHSADKINWFTYLSFTAVTSAALHPDVAESDIDDTDDEFTSTSHGLITGDVVRLTTPTSLPVGFELLTDYWVITVDANTFQLAASLSDAEAGTAIDFEKYEGAASVAVLEADVDPTGNTFTSVAHGLVTGDPVIGTTATTLPAPLTVLTTYWVIKISNDVFKLATTLANAVAVSPTPINITDDGTGAHEFSGTGAFPFTASLVTGEIKYPTNQPVLPWVRAINTVTGSTKAVTVKVRLHSQENV